MPKITDLPTADSVTPDDLVVIVDDVNGTPRTQKALVGDIVALATAQLSGVSWQGTWSNVTAYSISDVVEHNSDVYVAIDSSTDVEPGTDPTTWTKWVAQGPQGNDGDKGDDGDAGVNGVPTEWDDTGWVSGTFYERGVATDYNGSAYVCLVNHTANSGNRPGVGTEWQLLLVKGAKPWTTPTAWVTSHAYIAGDDYTPASAVTKDGGTYVCLVNHTSGVFDTDLGAGKWRAVAEKGAAGVVQTITGSGLVNVTGDGVDVDISVTNDWVYDFQNTNVVDGNTAHSDQPISTAPFVLFEGSSTAVNDGTSPRTYLVTGQVLATAIPTGVGVYAQVWYNTNFVDHSTGWTTAKADDVSPDGNYNSNPTMDGTGADDWHLGSISEFKNAGAASVVTIPYSFSVAGVPEQDFGAKVVVYGTAADSGLIPSSHKGIYGNNFSIVPVPA